MGRFYLFATGVARQHPHANTRTATRYQCYAFRDQYVKIEDVGFNLQEHNSVPCCLGVCVGNALINECGVHVCILSHNCHCANRPLAGGCWLCNCIRHVHRARLVKASLVANRSRRRHTAGRVFQRQAQVCDNEVREKLQEGVGEAERTQARLGSARQNSLHVHYTIVDHPQHRLQTRCMLNFKPESMNFIKNG